MQHTLCSFDWTFYSFSPTHLQMCLSIVLKHQKLTYTHLLSPLLQCPTISTHTHMQDREYLTRTTRTIFLSFSHTPLNLSPDSLTASFFSSISRVWNTYTFTYADRKKCMRSCSSFPLARIHALTSTRTYTHGRSQALTQPRYLCPLLTQTRSSHSFLSHTCTHKCPPLTLSRAHDSLSTPAQSVNYKTAYSNTRIPKWCHLRNGIA